MKRLISCALGLMIALEGSAHAQTNELRQVELLVRSHDKPAADILIDPQFSYLGSTRALVMNDRAEAQQHWFVKTEGARITRAVVVHFEQFRDGIEGDFEYPRIRMQTLAGDEYLHQSFAMENCGLVTADVKSLIAESGRHIADHCIATRFVRTTTADRRSELILFYVEPVAVLPSTEGMAPGGFPIGHDTDNPPESPWSLIDHRLTREALDSLTIRPVM